MTAHNTSGTTQRVCGKQPSMRLQKLTSHIFDEDVLLRVIPERAAASLQKGGQQERQRLGEVEYCAVQAEEQAH